MKEHENGSLAVRMLWDARMPGKEATLPSPPDSLIHSVTACSLCVCKQREETYCCLRLLKKMPKNSNQSGWQLQPQLENQRDVIGQEMHTGGRLEYQRQQL